MEQHLLVTALRDLKDQFLRLVDTLSAFHDLARIRPDRVDREELLYQALGALMENHGIARCSVFLADGDRLRCAAALDWDPRSGEAPRPCADDHSYPSSWGLMGRALEQGEMQHCPDLTQCDTFTPGENGPRTGSLVCVPVPGGEDPAGVLNAYHPEPGYFDRPALEVLQAIAGITGQLLSNWRYRRDMDRTVRERTAELERALEHTRQLKESFEQLSVIDELTGIHNRRFFFPEAQSALANACRHQQPFCVVMLDLDRFKEINDSYGHAVGDKVLQVTAALVKGQTREGDITARVGGEEFALALPNTDLQGGLQLAERILTSLQNVTFSRRGERIRITASLGVTALPPGVRSAQIDDLLQQADHAMYLAKTQGRNRISVYRPEPD